MTLGQAASRGIVRITRPSWEVSKWVELDLMRDPDGTLNGYVGPWAKQREAEAEELVSIFTLNEEEDWQPVEDVIPDPPPASANAADPQASSD